MADGRMARRPPREDSHGDPHHEPQQGADPRWSERRDGGSVRGSNVHRRAPSDPRATRPEPYATPGGPSDATRELARQPPDPREAGAARPGPRGAASAAPDPMRGDHVSTRFDNTATDAQGIRPVSRVRQPRIRRRDPDPEAATNGYGYPAVDDSTTDFSRSMADHPTIDGLPRVPGRPDDPATTGRNGYRPTAGEPTTTNGYPPPRPPNFSGPDYGMPPPSGIPYGAPYGAPPGQAGRSGEAPYSPPSRGYGPIRDRISPNYAEPPGPGYGQPPPDRDHPRGYAQPADRDHPRGPGQSPSQGAPGATGYGPGEGPPRAAGHGPNQPSGAAGYRQPPDPRQPPGTTGYGQSPHYGQPSGHGPSPYDRGPDPDRDPRRSYGPGPDYGPSGPGRSGPPPYDRPDTPRDRAPDDRVTPHETGRWSSSRGMWVPAEPREEAPGFAIERFEETSDLRRTADRGRNQVIDAADWTERLDQRPEWHPHNWDDAPTSRSTDWSESPLPPPPPNRRVMDVEPERDPVANELMGERVPAGTVSAALAPLMWFGLAIVAYLGAVFLFNDGAERAEALDAGIQALPWLGVASTMSVGLALAFRWIGAGWKAAGLGFAAAVVSGTLTTVLNSLIFG